VRLFFALWPDGEVVRELEAAANLLTLEGAARKVPAGNFHLTLAFIGEVSEQKLAVMQQIGRSIGASPFTVVCQCLEYWPGPRAVVAAVRNAPPALLALSETLQEAAELPQVPLRAHVTLARKLAQAPVLPAMSPIHWRATQLSLIRSKTGGSASAYTVVETWPLLYEA
jgi:RNA 2',3'-cyclic 3'-phosphodiesterase